MNKTKAVVGCTLAAAGLIWAANADAHTPAVVVTCGGIMWTGTQYVPGDQAVLIVNGFTQYATVGSDGTFYLAASFPGDTVSTYRYIVDSVDDEFDVDQSGSQQGCTTTTEASTTSAPTTTTTVTATTTPTTPASSTSTTAAPTTSAPTSSTTTTTTTPATSSTSSSSTLPVTKPTNTGSGVLPETL